MRILYILKKNFALLTLIAFLAVSMFALNFYSSDKMHNGMIACPYTIGEESMCPMDIVDHLFYWKQTFTADSVSMTKLVTILLFIPLVLLILREVIIFGSIKDLRQRFKYKNKHYKLFNWLLRTIGKVMQRRLYAPATVKIN